jgi:hypothetical protein
MIPKSSNISEKFHPTNMKNNTEVDYRNAIKAKYEVERSGDFHGFLENPSPAQIREFCLLKFDNGLNKIDESIFRMYFKVNDDENLRDSIYNYHIPKFKTVQSFLTEEDKKTNILNLNLIAALVDYNPRPFNKFARGYSEEPINEIKIEAEKLVEENKEIHDKKHAERHFIGNYLKLPFTKTKSSKKRAVIWMVIIIVIFSVGFTTKQFLLPKKECMQWQGDHYELVDCQKEISSLYPNVPIEPIDEKAIDLKKIEVCDTFPFYCGGKAVVRYCKVNDEPEYFDGPGAGFHPITKKQLNPITDYIINKYVRHK